MQMFQLFPSRPPAKPTIYGFANTRQYHVRLLKAAYTARETADRIAELWSARLMASRFELTKSEVRPDGWFPL